MALAADGYELALIDRDSVGVASVADVLRRQTTVHVFEADISDASSLDIAVDGILKIAPEINILINNAGVALHGHFDECSFRDIENVLQTNLIGALRLTYNLLARVKLSRGTIVNISSVFGLVAPAGQSAYAASKFGLRGFGEALGHELAGQGVRVLTVYPAGTQTGIARRAKAGAAVSADKREAQEARFARLARLDPDDVARQIVSAIARNERRLVIGRDARLADLLQRVAPARYGAIADWLARLVGRFTGRRL
jgi:short-subunit dehydrogenase